MTGIGFPEPILFSGYLMDKRRQQGLSLAEIGLSNSIQRSSRPGIIGHLLISVGSTHPKNAFREQSEIPFRQDSHGFGDFRDGTPKRQDSAVNGKITPLRGFGYRVLETGFQS